MTRRRTEITVETRMLTVISGPPSRWVCSDCGSEQIDLVDIRISASDEPVLENADEGQSDRRLAVCPH